MTSLEEWLDRVYASGGDQAALDSAYDEWAAQYDQQLWASANPYLALLSWVFGAYVPDRNARILDAGCGTGNMALLLHQLGYRIMTGLDPSAGMLELAERKGVYTDLHQQFLGSTVDLPSDSFDAVVAAGVLTHGHAPPEAVDGILSVTKPDGIVAFSLSKIAWDGGFAEKLDAREADGSWTKLYQSDLFRTYPYSEAEAHLRHWVFAYQKA